MKSPGTSSFLCLAVLLSIGTSIHAREKVTLHVTYPDGRTVKYKHKYSVVFKSDRSEVIVPGRTRRGFTSGEIRGEWRSREVIQEGETEAQTTRLVAKVSKAVNGFFFENNNSARDPISRPRCTWMTRRMYAASFSPRLSTTRARTASSSSPRRSMSARLR